MKRWIAASFVLVLVAAPAKAAEPATTLMAQSDWPADCKLERVAGLPMTLISGHVTIPATANDKDVTLVVDTAGVGTSLTMAAVHRLGAREALFGARLGNLRIGDLEWDNLYTGVLETFPGVDGLIANNMLDKYDAEFDFGDNKFNLFKHHPCSNRAVYCASYTVIPFTLVGDGHIRVSIALDGQNTDAILDTAAPVSLLSMQDAGNMFGLTSDSAGLQAARSVSGPRAPFWLAAPFKAAGTYTYPFKTLIMGGVTVPNPPIELIQARNFLGRDHATLLIGNDVLSHFHLYIAYRQQKLYLTDAESH